MALDKFSGYKKEFGDFAYYTNGNLQYMSHEISVAYDVDSKRVLKMGIPDRVTVWWEGGEWKGIFRDVVIATSEHWDPEDLNKISGGVDVEFIVSKYV